jgi:hypothetical protein
MADLDSLKAEIEAVGNQIKQAKGNKLEKSVIDPLVKTLLSLKQQYADQNNGIGVDGKPFGSAATASDTTKNSAAAKAQASQQGYPENAAKKAAKKADKAAKKAAYKVNLGGDDDGKPSNDSGEVAKVTIKTPVATATPKSASTFGNLCLSPLQLLINPNSSNMVGVGVLDRPYMALAVAVLTNTDVDLKITLDPRVPFAILGLESDLDNQHGDASAYIVGDFAMAKYLHRRAPAGPCNVLNANLESEALQNAWIDYASSLSQLGESQRWKGIAMTLEHALMTRTYLVGYSLTMADLALFATLGWPCTLAEKTEISSKLQDFPCALRWVNMLASHPALQKATQLATGDASECSLDHSDSLEPLVSGMNLLEGATPGHVVTRFPPEPSGYLHVRALARFAVALNFRIAFFAVTLML